MRSLAHEWVVIQVRVPYIDEAGVRGTQLQPAKSCLSGGSRGLHPTGYLPLKRRALALEIFRYAAGMPLALQELRTYFLTFVTAGRRRLFQVSANPELLLDVLRDNQSKHRLAVHAFVVMPDHVHLCSLRPHQMSRSRRLCSSSGVDFRFVSRVTSMIGSAATTRRESWMRWRTTTFASTSSRTLCGHGSLRMPPLTDIHHCIVSTTSTAGPRGLAVRAAKAKARIGNGQSQWPEGHCSLPCR